MFASVYFQREDYGSYKCIAKNPRGETDGTIRLYSKCLVLPLCAPSYPPVSFTKVMTVRRELFGAFMSCCHSPVVYEVDEDGRFSTNYVISTAHPLTDTVVSSGNARSAHSLTRLNSTTNARALRDLPPRQIYPR